MIAEKRRYIFRWRSRFRRRRVCFKLPIYDKYANLVLQNAGCLEGN